MPLARLTDGQHEGVSDLLNGAANEIDLLGIGVVVRRTTGLALPSGIQQVLFWQSADADINPGAALWSNEGAAIVTVTEAAVYTLVAQARFYPTSRAGQCALRLMVGGSNPAVNTIVTDKLPTANDGEGTTCSVTVTARLPARSTITTGIWQNSGAALTSAYTDFGGTFLSVSRSGPY